MTPKHLWTRIKKVWITLGIGATVIFVAWSLIAYRASAEARAATRSNEFVAIWHAEGTWRFTPARVLADTSVGLLFFPGGLVDPIAYAPLARAVATAGYQVIVVELPRRGAFGGAMDPDLLRRAADQMRKAGSRRRWVVAGHSRGAVVATSMAASRTPGIVGLVLVGTTHPRDVDLSALPVPVAKIVGTHDRIAPLKKAEANRHLLPPNTRWVRIEGGNHSQFGWYGFQPGDGFAEITREQQQAQMIAVILQMLHETEGGASLAI